MENGLVEKFPQHGNANEKFLYRTTEKGLGFLQISQQIESLIGIK